MSRRSLIQPHSLSIIKTYSAIVKMKYFPKLLIKKNVALPADAALHFKIPDPLLNLTSDYIVIVINDLHAC